MPARRWTDIAPAEVRGTLLVPSSKMSSSAFFRGAREGPLKRNRRCIGLLGGVFTEREGLRKSGAM